MLLIKRVPPKKAMLNFTSIQSRNESQQFFGGANLSGLSEPGGMLARKCRVACGTQSEISIMLATLLK